MKTQRIFLAVVMVVMISVLLPGAAFSEAPSTIKSSSAIKDVLNENMGKRVIVKVGAGEEFEGTVTMVGENVVHMSKLAGKEYYDAVILINRISAVVYRTK